MNKGYTFIELICVVIIVGILAGISVPQVKNVFLGVQLESTAQELRSFMDYVRQRSFLERVVIRIHISPDEAEYWAAESGSVKRLKTFRIPSGIHIESDKEEIFFYPDGKSDKADIRLEGPSGRNILLTTRGILGGVKVVYER
ncbi:MAG: prepilin-type N-terminal cleavage/methylation domain-containing protein [Candidatus Omnitrophica bacterium]|nr:prepilin-type N-terminal cleavage/methylation domain-containing protein [Candidatus Omnitrophota bacterium]